MQKLMDLVGMTVGGWLGWQLGMVIGFFTAFLLGVVGTGVGMFAVRRATRRLMP